MDKKLVLIVDDEPEMRNVLRQAFEFSGFEVAEADDGEAGLKLFTERQPVLVVSDIYMPKMNGLHLLRNIRRQRFDAKVILITGFSNYRQLTYDINSRPDGYFEKPFSLANLIGKANEVLAAA